MDDARAAAVIEPGPRVVPVSQVDTRFVNDPGAVRAIVEAMSDELSRRIMASASSNGKTMLEISAENGIPISTAYRKVHRLAQHGLLIVERIVITRAGKRLAVYRGAFGHLKIELQPGGLCVQVTPVEGVASRLGEALVRAPAARVARAGKGVPSWLRGPAGFEVRQALGRGYPREARPRARHAGPADAFGLATDTDGGDLSEGSGRAVVSDKRTEARMGGGA